MKKIMISMLFSLIFLAGGMEFLSESFAANTTIDDNSLRSTKFEQFKCFVKGQPARNGMLIGLWSKHVFSSDDDYRTTHNLIAWQHQGYFVGTFANSYSHQVVAVGLTRTVITEELNDDWLFEIGYKIGPMYGYRDEAPNIGGISILPVASFGLSFQDVGVDLNLVPGNALSINMRVNF